MHNRSVGDMEVAGQWRREWAGTAEYGKVIEEGRTRHVARAMEVMHASSGGTRVRVMRAAYHSSSGARGLPAASFVLQSSRRTISSGSRLLDSPKLMNMPPLEISSIPLESSPERDLDTNGYKVTEPDDTEISEPSKWRSSIGAGTKKHFSEESSSSDNTSFIDLDPPMSISKHTNLLRKFSFDSDNASEVSFGKKMESRLSPLLDVPPSLNTLQYKSLLNGTNGSWNDRRKSYSFERTTPPKIYAFENNDTKAMESSTDSGICKSTDLLNDNAPEQNQDKILQDGGFKDWLSRDRMRNSYRDKKYNNENSEDKISLQSKGKVSITIPVSLDRDNTSQKYNTEEVEKRNKKVGFSKTELHFAAETGTVNIIATDNKPPPSNDYRKRRSAFVPIKNPIDRPITLFGEKSKRIIDKFDFENDNEQSDAVEFEDQISKRSILKNKIPKPKPYHLGADSVIGDLEGKDIDNQTPKEYIIRTRLESPDFTSDFAKKDRFKITEFASRTKTEGSINDSNKSESLNNKITPVARNCTIEESSKESKVKQTLDKFQGSPILPGRTRIRPLRDSDLAYFGINNKENNIKKTYQNNAITTINSDVDDEFKSVKLIRKISSSVQDSESEYDETPKYQNIIPKTILTPIPKPRYIKDEIVRNDRKLNNFEVTHNTSHNKQECNENVSTRRSKLKRSDSNNYSTSRSISEPPKQRLISRLAERHQDGNPSNRFGSSPRQYTITEDPTNNSSSSRFDIEDTSPLYANINKIEVQENIPIPTKRTQKCNESKSSANDNNTAPRIKPERIKSGEKDIKTKSEKLTDIKSNSSYKQHTNKTTTKENINLSGRDTTERKQSYDRKHNETLQERKQGKDRTETKENKQNNSDSDYKGRNTREYKIPLVENSSKQSMKAQLPKHSPKGRFKEIIINYDDKNGTASSIGQAKQVADKNKYNSKQRDTTKHDSRKRVSPDKRLLLDETDQDEHWIRSGLIQASRKPRSKNAVQRTCEIL